MFPSLAAWELAAFREDDLPLKEGMKVTDNNLFLYKTLEISTYLHLTTSSWDLYFPPFLSAKMKVPYVHKSGLDGGKRKMKRQ